MTTCSVTGCDMSAKRRGWCIKHYTRVIRYGSPYGFKPRPTVAERFWAKVDKTETCWLWTASDDGHGYGTFNAGTSRETSVYVKAHRYAYEQLIGTIPEGLVLDHLCHTPACVNPAHLRSVPQRINSQNRQGVDPRSTTGYRGVRAAPNSGRYRAYIGHKYRQIHLGSYDSAEEASRVAAEARAHYFELPGEAA